jgi:hopanoid biosynthesis associated radical SAM protein HpnH
MTTSLDVEVTISPGYAYERAADQQHFLNREKTKNLFRDLFKRGAGENGGGAKAWKFTNSPLFLDFLAGNRSYQCTPWSMPLRTVFGWQKPCYLVGEGYVETFAELMEGTDWDQYGVGKYENAPTAWCIAALKAPLPRKASCAPGNS